MDTVSTLNFTMGKGTNFTGTINIVENAEGGTAVDNNAVITVEEGGDMDVDRKCHNHIIRKQRYNQL